MDKLLDNYISELKNEYYDLYDFKKYNYKLIFNLESRKKATYLVMSFANTKYATSHNHYFLRIIKLSFYSGKYNADTDKIKRFLKIAYRFMQKKGFLFKLFSDIYSYRFSLTHPVVYRKYCGLSFIDLILVILIGIISDVIYFKTKVDYPIGYGLFDPFK